MTESNLLIKLCRENGCEEEAVKEGRYCKKHKQEKEFEEIWDKYRQ